MTEIWLLLTSSFLASFSLSFNWMSENTTADLDKFDWWLVRSLVDLMNKVPEVLRLLMMSEMMLPRL